MRLYVLTGGSLNQRAAIDRRSLLVLHGVFAGALLLVLVLGGTGWMPAPDTSVGLVLLAAIGGLAALLGWRSSTAVTGWVLVGDTFVLMALLAATGGVANPFTLLFLLPVLLASLALTWPWAASLALLTTGCFAALYAAGPAHHHMDMSQHLVGMVAAYGVTVPVLAAGVLRFRRAVAEAEEEAGRARRSRATAERLASLAALAGGAAHELATPLGSVLLIAREIERATEGEVHEDARLIAQEILRCREVLDQLVADAGGMGEGWTEVELPDFLAEALRGHPVVLEVPSVRVALPERLMAQCMRRLVGNAEHAGAETVTVRAERSSTGRWTLAVHDDGKGMSPAVLDQAMEPFFTTRKQGRGLGLFFVHSVCTGLGGSFELTSTEGVGTVARLVLPEVHP